MNSSWRSGSLPILQQLIVVLYRPWTEHGKTTALSRTHRRDQRSTWQRVMLRFHKQNNCVCDGIRWQIISIGLRKIEEMYDFNAHSVYISSLIFLSGAAGGPPKAYGPWCTAPCTCTTYGRHWHKRKLYTSLTRGMVVWWPWLTSKCVTRVCQHQLSFLLTRRFSL